MKTYGKTDMNRLVLTVFLAVGLAQLTACDAGDERPTVDLQDRVSQPPPPTPEVSDVHNADSILYFGFDLRASPQEDARQYLPFMDYLNTTTGYEFQLRFTPKSSSLIEELGNGRLHFAAIGADSYIKAREKYGVVSVVRGLNLQGKAEYRSKIVVRPDSLIQTLGDLKGTRFAFGSINSTQGHLIPRIVMEKHGLKLTDFVEHFLYGIASELCQCRCRTPI